MKSWYPFLAAAVLVCGAAIAQIGITRANESSLTVTAPILNLGNQRAPDIGFDFSGNYTWTGDAGFADSVSISTLLQVAGLEILGDVNNAELTDGVNATVKINEAAGVKLIYAGDNLQLAGGGVATINGSNICTVANNFCAAFDAGVFTTAPINGNGTSGAPIGCTSSAAGVGGCINTSAQTLGSGAKLINGSSLVRIGESSTTQIRFDTGGANRSICFQYDAGSGLCDARLSSNLTANTFTFQGRADVPGSAVDIQSTHWISFNVSGDGGPAIQQLSTDPFGFATGTTRASLLTTSMRSTTQYVTDEDVWVMMGGDAGYQTFCTNENGACKAEDLGGCTIDAQGNLTCPGDAGIGGNVQIGALEIVAPSTSSILLSDGVNATVFIDEGHGVKLVYAADNLSLAGGGVATVNGSNICTAGGTCTSNVSSGVNAFSVANNGGRIDFGAGANDWCSSDGTNINCASATATSGSPIVTSATNADSQFSGYYDGTVLASGELITQQRFFQKVTSVRLTFTPTSPSVDAVHAYTVQFFDATSATSICSTTTIPCNATGPVSVTCSGTSNAPGDDLQLLINDGACTALLKGNATVGYHFSP